MAADNYLAFCESLWRRWLDGDLQLPPDLACTFDLNAAPEPYLSFDVGPRPLIAVTTNPGATMPHQVRSAVLAGWGPTNSAMAYSDAARGLAAFYEQHLKGPARARIDALQELAQLVAAEGLLQVEVIPFHSRSLPKKSALVRSVSRDGLLAEYVDHVREFVSGKRTVVVSAVSSKVELGPGVRLSRWLTWQSQVIGIDAHRATFVPLLKKNLRTTCAAFISGGSGSFKALVLMMGGNHLPGVAGLQRLAEAIRSRCQPG